MPDAINTHAPERDMPRTGPRCRSETRCGRGTCCMHGVERTAEA